MGKSSTSFKPGQSGNPGGGRVKLVPEMRDRALKAISEHVLQAWIDEVVGRGPHWVRCSELLAAYGIGKPPQAAEPAAEGAQSPASLTLRVVDATTATRKQ